MINILGLNVCTGNQRERQRRGALIAPEDENDYKSSSYIPNPIPWVRSKCFHQKYLAGPELGSGAFSTVYECTENSPPHQVYAVKVVEGTRMSRKKLIAFKNEIEILADLKHSGVVRLHECYKEPGYFFVVQKKLDGGELFDKLCQETLFSEMHARDIMRAILEATAYCHQRKVAHRYVL